MASQATLKALGLNYSPNNLALPEGSLLVANDVIIRRDNVVESRRGFKDYSEGLGATNEPIKQLIEYKERILAHYGTKIAYDTLELNTDGQSIFNDFSGNYTETEPGLRIKSIVANKNLYFTTSEGIKKLSAKSAEDFSTSQIVNAGAIKALDLTANLDIEQGQTVGFLPADSAVAYRVLWGYKDANDNIIYGAPSERTLVYNYLQDIIPLDLNTLLNAIDNLNQSGSMINDGNYYQTYKLTLSDSVETFKTNVLGLAEKLDNDILYADLNATPATAPLTIDTLQVNIGSIGQINFPIAQDPTTYFEENDYIKIEGFTSEPVTTSISLTNVGGNLVTPENPVTITTNPNDLVNGREVIISGTTTTQNINGTYTVTVDENTIISTSGGGQIPTTTIESGDHEQRTINSSTSGIESSALGIISGSGAANTITNIAQTAAQTGSAASFASTVYLIFTNTTNLQNGDKVVFSGLSVDPLGNIANGVVYTVAGLNVIAPNSFSLLITEAVTSNPSYSAPSINVQTATVDFTVSSNHTLDTGEYLEISGSNFTYGGSSTSINGTNLQVRFATSGTNTFQINYPDLLNSNPTPTYGLATECLRLSGGTSLTNNELVKIVGITSTPSLYTSSTIDNSIELYVRDKSGDNFYLSYTNGGDRIRVQNASIPSSAKAYNPVEITLDTTHNFDNGKFVKIAGSTSNPSINDTWKAYLGSTAAKIKILPEFVLTTTATGGTVTECIQFRSIGSSLSNGDVITIQNPATNYTISGITTGSPTTTITTSTNHGLATNNTVVISGVTQTGGSAINGTQTVTVTGLNTFTIPTASVPTGINFISGIVGITTFNSNPIISGQYYVQELDNTGEYFYISALNELPIQLAISSNATGTPTIFQEMVIQTATNHGFIAGNWITISNSQTTPSIDGSWKISRIKDSDEFGILPTGGASYTHVIPPPPAPPNNVGTVNRITIPVNVDTVTVGTGSVKSTVGKNLTIFNGNFQITSVVAPSGTTKGYIQFLLPNNPDNFTETSPNAIKDVNAKIYSYDYRQIVNSSDIFYAITLNDLEISPIGTSEQLRIIENNILRISNKLKSENSGVIPAILKTKYLENYSITLNGNVKLEITVPDGINDNYFYQVYRTRVFTAEGIQSLGSLGDVPVVPDDEMRLVLEAFPPTPIPSIIEVEDNYPEDLALTNENLYTNPVTGSGVSQSNDTPPLAKDINVFKNSVFYANTKTKQRLNPFQLIGTSNIGGLNNNKLTIGNVNGSITYIFTPGVQQTTTITVANVAATIKTDIQDKYITLNTPVNSYYLWFKYDGAGTDPAPANYKQIVVNLLTGDDANTVATKINNSLGAEALDFTSSVLTNVVTTINYDEGICTAPSNNTTGSSLSISVIQTGDGEDSSATPFPKVLLSQIDSRSQAIDLTARSLVKVINKQNASPTYAYYISGEDSSPGIINLEAKNLVSPEFYVIGNGDDIGSSFTPDISPEKTATAIAAGTGNEYVFTSASHGLKNDDKIIISGSNCSPNIDGVYSVTVTGVNTFKVTGVSALSVVGTYAAFTNLVNSVVSTNEEKQNRVYYSKTSQPEAVPILNFFDVGSSDKAILRLFPVRDSLFVFKEDGLYRISGEEIPFVVTLFDSSCIVAAPDSVSISNNIIYAWTVKGISNISESGVAEISRPIDTEILKLASNRYSNFKTLTWGIGYDSDNSYTVFTNSESTDEYATIGFRYSDLTNTWTNINRSQNCGIILSSDNKLYTAGSEDNFIYQERKNFDRTDYSDSDFDILIQNGNISNAPSKPVGTRIFFSSINNINTGDIITQNQIVTHYLFNALLDKLDLDPTVGLKNIISSSGTGSTVTITTSGNHYLSNNDYVTLSNTNSFPLLDGNYKVFNTTPTTFDITVSNFIITQATSGKAKRSYSLTLSAQNGDSLRNKIVDLASYLDTDPGLNFTNYSSLVANYSGSILSNSADNPTEITTSSPHNLVDGRLVTIIGTPASPVSDPTLENKTFAVTVTSPTTFTVPLAVITAGSTGLTYSTSANQLNMLDIQACFNTIIDNLNSDTGATFINYKLAEDSSLLEAVIVKVNTVAKYIEVNLPLSWTDGIVTIYKAIPCQLIYAPITFGDPLSIKQIYEATMMFDNKAFTKATASFNTDLKPQFLSVDFYGQGNGIFGHYSDPGFGYGFFGGLSNSAPFRTIIPREAQRCRFLTVKFEHNIGREKWALNGITLTGNMGLSNRGYR